MAPFIDGNCSSSNPIHTKNKRKRKGNNRKKENPKSLIIPCSSIISSSYSLTFHGHDAAAALLSLPEDILILILNKLDCFGFHRFGAACRFFRYSVAAAAKKMQIRRHHQNQFQFPWLMLSFGIYKNIGTPLDPHRHSHNNPYHHRGFFSAFHQKVFGLGMLPMADTICCGSNLGWLILFSWARGRMFLFNPITGVRIELPHKSTFPWPVKQEQLALKPVKSRNFISKVMLLSPNHSNSKSNSDDGNSNNNVDDCLILVIYWENLVAFCRPGDKAWTGFTKHYVEDEPLYQDFIVYDGKLYAIKYNYDLVLVELGGSDQPKETSYNIAPPPVPKVNKLRLVNPDYLIRNLYLVECDGELLMVIRWVRVYGCFGYGATQTTLMLEIFKLETQHLRWVKVEDLGDQMLFVGTSSSFSLSSLHCPGFRGNCIYFTDGYLSFNRPEVGVFYLEDNSVKPFYTIYSKEEDSVEAKSLPIWFTPNSW